MGQVKWRAICAAMAVGSDGTKLGLDFPDLESQSFMEWGESIDIDAIPGDDIEEEPAAKRQKTSPASEGRSKEQTGDGLQVSSVTRPASFACSAGPAGPVACDDLHPDGYLSRGVFHRTLHTRDIYPGMFTGAVVRLFGAKFVTGNALLHHTEKLFFLLRQQIFKMEEWQKRGQWPMTDGSLLCSRKIRKDCSAFMAYVHSYLCSSLCDTDKPDDTLQQFGVPPRSTCDADVSSRLRSHLEALLVFLGPLAKLPASSYARGDTLPGTTAVRSPAGQVFHLYLDLQCTSLLAIYELWNRQGQSGDVTGSELQTSVQSAAHSILWDLVAIAAVHHNKSRTQSRTLATCPWTCSCVRELWVLLIQLTDHIAARTELQSFWSVVSSIMSDVLNPCDQPDSQGSGLQSHAPPDFSVQDPPGFCWWLLTHLAPLYWYNDQGAFVQRVKGSVPGNWVLAHDLLKSSLQRPREGSEEVERRFCLKCCIVLSQHWSANSDVLLWLWDHFHKRMNESFHVPGHSLSNIAIVSTSALQWMEQCYSRAQPPSPSSLELEPSFSLFLRLVALHLAKLLRSGSLQGWRQMKGRFYSKFHKRRMEELNETGLRHFISLFLTLASVVDLEDVASKMCSFLDLVDFRNAQPNKRSTILIGIFSLMLIYKEKKSDFSFLVGKVARMFADLAREFSDVASRDRARGRSVWPLVSSYLSCTQEVLEHRNRQNLSEAGLLGEGFQFLFSCCRDNELRHLLTFVQSILTTLRSDLGRQSSEDTADSRAALWNHAFPHIRKLTSDRQLAQSFPDHLADTLAGFLFMALDRHPEVVHVGSSETFLTLFQEFCCQDDIPASLCCRLLCHVLPCAEARDVLVAGAAQCAVLHTWFRCLLQRPPTTDSLPELTRAVCKLPDMGSMIKDEYGFTSRELGSETALQLFVAALGRHHAALNKFDERIQFREKALGYLGDFIRHVEPVLTAAGPPDLLRLAYRTAGSLVEYCSRLIYSKTQPHCLLPRLLDRLILPLPNSKKPVAPAAAQCSKRFLHQFLRGLATLDHHKDEFVRRKIRQLMTTYFGAINQECYAAAHSSTAVSANPFLVALRDSCVPKPDSNASDFRQFLLSIVADSHLTLPQSPPKLAPTLHFLERLFKDTSSRKEIARNTPTLLKQVLGCLIACNSYSAANEPANIRKPATEILRLMFGACGQVTEMNMREILLPILRDFLFCNLLQLQGLVFKTFATLTTFDHELLVCLIPASRQAITQSEQKRGVGTDAQLRSAYKSWLKLLGDPGAAEIDRLNREREESSLSQELLQVPSP